MSNHAQTQMNNGITEYDVVLAYRVLLERDPDTRALVAFDKEFRRRTVSRRELIQGILRSDEFKDKYDLPRNAVSRDLGGYVVYMRPEDLDIGAVIASGGDYEPQVAAVIKEYAKPGSTVLDIGANIGFFTMLAASLVGEDGRVIAVEPLDKNLQLIYLALAQNGFKQVEVLPFAAANSTSVLAAHTTVRTSNAEIKEIDHAQKHELFTISRPLDSVLKDLTRLDLVKIDIAGSEPIAFAGLMNTLSRLQPVVVTQFHPQALERNAKVSGEQYARTLFDYAPTVFALQSKSDRICCENPAHAMEVWRQVNETAGADGGMYIDLLAVP